MEKIKVAILGATGTVGQKFVTLLYDHPYFEIHELVASERSAGKKYSEACRWKQNIPIPENVRDLVVKTTDTKLESKILFSGLDSSVAGPVEERYANEGHYIISNSKNHRMDSDVPLVIPEINHDHLDIIKQQKYKGAIVTNSNCSTMFLTMALAPIYKEFGIEAVHVTTMQAISGAGYPGVPSLDILGNVIPFIGGEEDKVETEPLKILGTYKNGKIEHADFKISAHCNRVPVYDGHTETVSIKLKKKAEPEEVARILDEFSGLPQELKLPLAPEKPIVVFNEPDRPQPFRDVWLNRGMSACVGRIRKCPIYDIKLVVLGHNTVRGAAGAAVLNAETMYRKGLIE